MESKPVIGVKINMVLNTFLYVNKESDHGSRSPFIAKSDSSWNYTSEYIS